MSARPTKADRFGHNEAELSVSQEAALEALLRGATDAEAGEAGAVTRQTVNGWRNHEPAFIAELNRRRALTRDAGADKIRGLVSRAVDALGAGLDSQDERIRHSAAVVILKATGIADGGAEPSGPTRETEVRRMQDLDEALYG